VLLRCPSLPHLPPATPKNPPPLLLVVLFVFTDTGATSTASGTAGGKPVFCPRSVLCLHLEAWHVVGSAVKNRRVA
jgi:hypothetical protein